MLKVFQYFPQSTPVLSAWYWGYVPTCFASLFYVKVFLSGCSGENCRIFVKVTMKFIQKHIAWWLGSYLLVFLISFLFLLPAQAGPSYVPKIQNYSEAIIQVETRIGP